MDDEVRTLRDQVRGLLAAGETHRAPPFKVELPTFDGKGDVQLWIRRFERASRILRLSGTDLVDAALVHGLRGAALQRVESDERLHENWDEMKQALLTTFCDTTQQYTLIGRLRGLRMSSQSATALDSYYSQHAELVRQLDPPLPPYWQFIEFFFGLPGPCREWLLSAEVRTVERGIEVLRRRLCEVTASVPVVTSGPQPMDLDSLNRLRGAVSFVRRDRGRSRSHSRSAMLSQSDARSDRQHPSSPKRQSSPSDLRRSSSPTCFGCGAVGHFRRDCPDPTTTARGPSTRDPKKTGGRDTGPGKGQGPPPPRRSGRSPSRR